MSSKVEDEDKDTKFEEVPFAVLVEFFEIVASAKPREISSRRLSNEPRNGTVPKFLNWIERLLWPVPPRTGAILFRLLFPDQDIRRKYNLQETKLGQNLAQVLNVSNQKPAQGLSRWNRTIVNKEGVNVGQDGCLGLEVEKILQNTYDFPEELYTLSISDVDRLLDELAAKSMWSNLKDCESRKPPRTVHLILKDLYDTLSPRQAAYMTQIILKDLRPLLYPVPALSTSQSLNEYNSKAYDELNQWSMMKSWHWAMPRIYRAKADFDRAADLVEQIPRDLDRVPDKNAVYSIVDKLSELELGVPVDIPKAVKASGTCLASTISKLKGDVWAEVKLDGERMQIHVDMSKPEKEQIQIFSKTHRDSTGERVNTLIPIRAALGLPLIASCKLIDENPRPSDKPRIVSGIFEAEMVAWNLTKQHVDEFWRISELKRKPSRKGQKATQNVIEFYSDEESGYESEGMDTQERSDRHRRHLAVVFFDVLSINGQSVIDSPYAERRRLLEDAVQVIPNYAMLIERKKFTNVNDPVSLDALRDYYAKIIAERHEGLMLKADQSCYNDYKPGLRWYKVKKDYIKGYGDTADYAILGAGWDRDRARELRVSTATYTAWYVGLCKNMSDVERKGAMPVFEIVFKALSYGLTRANLHKLNQDARQVGGFPHTSIKPSTLPFEYELAHGLSVPDIIFKKPMVFELMGSGFTKRSRRHAYELRWPRIIKAHDPNERDWKIAIDLSEHNQIARRATDPEILKAKNDDLKAYKAEIKAWKERLFRDDDNWNKKRSNKKVSTTTSTNAYIPDWLSDTSDEFSDTSECLADVITMTSPVTSKAPSLTLRAAPLSTNNPLAQTSSTPPRRKASTFSSRTMASSPECISPTGAPKGKEVEREVTYDIPSRKRMNTDSTSSSRTVKFRLQSDDEQGDDNFATPTRPERQLKSVSTSRSSRFGPSVTKSLTLDKIQRVRHSLDTTSIQSTSAEQRQQTASENNTSLARRTHPKRSLPDSPPQEYPHRSKRRLTEYPTERTRAMYQPIQNDIETSAEPHMSTRSAKKNSNSTRTSPTKDLNPTRPSPTKDSILTRTSPMQDSHATRLSPMKDSSSNSISPNKNLKSPRKSPMKGSTSTSTSPNKDSPRKPRLVQFTPTLPKSATKLANNADQLPSVTAPSPSKNPSEQGTASVSGASTPTPSQARKLYVPPAIDSSKYRRRSDVSRPSSSPQQARINSPARAAIHRSAFKASISSPTSLPQVTTASSTPAVPKYPKSHLSRPLVSPHQVATTSHAQAASHVSGCQISAVSCPSSLPQVTTTSPAPIDITKLNDSRSEDVVKRKEDHKEDHIIPEINSSNLKTNSVENPPWLETSNVQWCLVEDQEDFGISGTRHKSISNLINSIDDNSNEKIHYIFIKKPKKEIIERIRKQIIWKKIINPNFKFIIYDSKVLKKSNLIQFNSFKLFDHNSIEFNLTY